jgi:hypothetical protein
MLVARSAHASYRRAAEFQGEQMWIDGAANIAAGMAISLALWAVVVAAFALFKSWRLSADSKVLAAAERYEAVNLTSVIKRYVPAEHQTNRVAEEIAIARQVIGLRRPRWRLTAILSCGFIIVCAAGAAAFSFQREPRPAAPPLSKVVTARPAPNFDVLKDIQGVWGWRADFAQSCEQNPQTITVTADGKKLSIRYAKPYRDRPETGSEFAIDSVRPDTLVALNTGSTSPVRIYFKFLDKDSFVLSWSNDSTSSSGTVARCR